MTTYLKDFAHVSVSMSPKRDLEAERMAAEQEERERIEAEEAEKER